jgi:hypothetical protein
LGATLAILIALNVLRSEGAGGAGADLAGGSRDEAPPAQRAMEAARGSASGHRRPDATEGESRAAPAESQSTAVSPTPGPYPSISAALEDHDVPPERRMPVLPELIETDRAFAAETVDPLWSTAAESAVLSRIAEVPGAAYVSVNVECRQTLCLLQFVESATPAPGSGIAEITSGVGSLGLKPMWMFGIRVRGGAPLGIAYLQRVEATGTRADAP